MNTSLMYQTAYQNIQSIDAIRQRCAQTFWQLLFIGKWRCLWKRLQRKSVALMDLNTFKLAQKINTRHHLGVRTVAINQIVGSEGRTQDFDSDFYPRQTHSRSRWIGIAIAVAMGKTLHKHQNLSKQPRP